MQHATYAFLGATSNWLWIFAVECNVPIHAPHSYSALTYVAGLFSLDGKITAVVLITGCCLDKPRVMWATESSHYPRERCGDASLVGC